MVKEKELLRTRIMVLLKCAVQHHRCWLVNRQMAYSSSPKT